MGNQNDKFDTNETLERFECNRICSVATIEELISFLKSNGATAIRSWASVKLMCIAVREHDAHIILQKLKSDRKFTKIFVDDWLPPACRDSTYPNVKRASVKDVEEIIRKAISEIEKLSTFTGILLDVSGSMKDSIGEGIDEEGGTWAQSIFTVINDLVEHEVAESSSVFAIGFGARRNPEIFDIIGTINDIQNIKGSDDTRMSTQTGRELLDCFRGNDDFCTWARKNYQSACQSISKLQANVLLPKLRSDREFLQIFIRNCLPKNYRKVTQVTTVVNEIVEKAIQLMKEMFMLREVSNESIFSIKQAASIIRGCSDERDLTKERAHELLTAVEPYIYGKTPFYSALKKALSFFLLSEYEYLDQKRLLFVVSDGMPTDHGNLIGIQQKLQSANVIVVGCYISRLSNVKPRTLHCVAGHDWEEGAKVLFNLSSTIATQLVTKAAFIKQGWNIDITNNDTKLFMHVNHPDHLREACNLAQNIVCSQDALSNLLASVSIDIYINQKNTGFKAQHQEGGTCYANASAAVLHLAMHRVCGRIDGYPDFDELRDELISKNGIEGANTFQVLTQVCPNYRLHCKEVDITGAKKAVAEKRPVVATFRLSDEKWEKFGSFYRKNPTGILRKDDLSIGRHDKYYSTGGHAVVLTSYNNDCLRLMNSWGEEWADHGFFRVENAEVLGLKFIDVYWTINDLFPKELDYYRVHGSEIAEQLIKSLKSLQVAEYECPRCNAKSKVTSFSGSWSSAKCPKCNSDFPCKDGKGNILALNVYLTSLSR